MIKYPVDDLYDHFEHELAGTADVLKVPPQFNEATADQIASVLLENFGFGTCAGCGTWADLDDEYCEVCKDEAWK